MNLNKSRICMIVFSYFPDDPRVKREVDVIKDIYYVDIICLKNDVEKKYENNKNVSIYRIMKGNEDKESILKYIYLTIKFVLLAIIYLLKLSFKYKYNIIHIHNMPDYLSFIGLFHKVKGTPIILDLHDLSVELFLSKWKGIKVKMLKPFVIIVEKLSCSMATKLITTSKGFKNRLIERGIDENKIILIMNTPDGKIFKTNNKRKIEVLKNGDKLLYHGTVAYRFGLHVVIKALYILKKQNFILRLNIYGKYDPTYKLELEKLITKYELNDQVTLNYYVPNEKVAELIENSDFGIVPYLSDPFMDLALSTKTFEYIEMHLPIIASRIPSLENIFPDDSITYFEPNNPQDLYLKLLNLRNDPKIIKDKVVKIKSIYKQYSWNIMAQKYLNLLQELIK